jgi:cellulose biosynthesis protein BcsQ
VNEFAAAVVEEMKSVFKRKMFKTIIPLDEVAAVAPATRKTAIDYKPLSAVAEAYNQLAMEVNDALS